MTDPYQVLNIPSSATDEEVKKAYRDLARKYHPDRYHDNPLADLAQEKMKEINEAYDLIQRQRGAARQGQSGGYHQGYSTGYSQGGSGQGAGSPAFQRVRMAINRNDLAMAEQLLGQIGDHDAEWNYLKGVICYRRGWADEARRYFQTACQMDPGNNEYYQALNRMQSAGEAYRPAGFEVFSTGCGDNLCLKLGCMYCACNTCGGVPIFCY